MSEEEPTFDGVPGLQVSGDARVKAAFDPHIASLTLRPKTNDPTEGYHLSATAYFGVQSVELPVDDGPDSAGKEREIFTFRFEMFQAELILEPVNCDFDYMYAGDRSVEAPIAVSKLSAVDNREVSTKIKVESGKLFEELTGAKLGLERQVDGRREKAPDAWYEITIIDDKTIKFASRGEKPVPLQGRLLDDFVGWRIIPISDCPSGVLGRLRTRESWIELKNAQPVGRIGKWSEALLDLLQGKGPRYTFRRKAFDILLSHLVARGLQDGAETRDATLAADTVIVLPTPPNFTKVTTEPRPFSLDFRDHPIATFLRFPVGQEKTALREIGVPQNRIEDLGFPPDSPDDDSLTVSNSRPLDYMIEIHIDRVISNIQRTETRWGLLKPVISEAVTLGNPAKLISASAAKRFGLLMTRSECEELIDLVMAQPNMPKHFLSEKRALTKLKDNRGRYAVSFFQLSGILFGEKFTSSYLTKNRGRIEHFISMYDVSRRL